MRLDPAVRAAKAKEGKQAAPLAQRPATVALEVLVLVVAEAVVVLEDTPSRSDSAEPNRRCPTQSSHRARLGAVVKVDSLVPAQAIPEAAARRARKARARTPSLSESRTTMTPTPCIRSSGAVLLSLHPMT